jgi:2-iminobutanoate/2-iminopropanoate deaminase
METTTRFATVFTEGAPAPIGPYSQGTTAAGFLFTAGQLGLGSDGALAAGGAAEQARMALENLRAVLEAGGSSLDRVVKTTVFLLDMNDFAAVNAVYAEFFDATKPARSTIQVARLPKDGLVEIEAIALTENR